MIDQDIHEAFRLADLTNNVWRNAQEELARFDELQRRAAEPISAKVAQLETAFQRAGSIADIGSPAIARLSVMPLPNVSDLTKPLWEYSSVLNAAGPMMLDQQVRDQWRPALMRWSQPHVAEILSVHRGALARAVSEAARPEISAIVARATQDLVRSPIAQIGLLPADLDGASVFVPTLPRFGRPLTEIPLWPALPEVAPEPQEEQTAPDPGGGPWGTDTATKSKLDVHERRIETLERSTGRTQPSQAREFVVRAGATIVGGSIVQYIWGYTPAGEYIDLVIRGIVVYIEGAYYVLPYIAP